jgi:hypothetical protein
VGEGSRRLVLNRNEANERVHVDALPLGRRDKHGTRDSERRRLLTPAVLKLRVATENIEDKASRPNQGAELALGDRQVDYSVAARRTCYATHEASRVARLMLQKPLQT